MSCLKRTAFSLRLLHSGIRQFPPCYFNNWRRLQHLILTGNELTEIPAIESLFSSLYSLFLDENDINTIYGSWASARYRRLNFIHLHNNKLTEFNFTYLTAIPINAEISLVDNQIAHLHQSTTYLHNAYRIDMTGNPLVCDAKMAWVAASNLSISNGICVAPRRLHGADLSRLSTYIDIGVSGQNRYCIVFSFTPLLFKSERTGELLYYATVSPGSAFIKPDQFDPWIKDQVKITLLSTVDNRVFLIWSLIHGLSWSGSIKAEPDIDAFRSCSGTWRDCVGLFNLTEMHWTPFQYPIRPLTVRSRDLPKPRVWLFKSLHRFKIWQARRQHCQMSKRSWNSEYNSCGLEILQ